MEPQSKPTIGNESNLSKIQRYSMVVTTNETGITNGPHKLCLKPDDEGCIFWWTADIMARVTFIQTFQHLMSPYDRGTIGSSQHQSYSPDRRLGAGNLEAHLDVVHIEASNRCMKATIHFTCIRKNVHEIHYVSFPRSVLKMEEFRVGKDN
jgi:hypothetical protein